MNDRCPLPNFFANMETTFSICQTFSLHCLSRPQEMSLNIDINRIIPVTVSGVSLNLLSRSVTFTMELQRGESWEKVPLEFSGLSTDSIIVSVALRSCAPFYSVLQRFVGIWMLMDPSQDTIQNLKRRRLSRVED